LHNETKLIVHTFGVATFKFMVSGIPVNNGDFFLVIHHMVPPSFFMRKFSAGKYRIDQENSDFFMRRGNTTLSQYRYCPDILS
jgi:hypothetical protein